MMIHGMQMDNELKTPEELAEIRTKWDRLTNPKTVADYGLSINIKELMVLPEAREELYKYGVLHAIVYG